MLDDQTRDLGDDKKGVALIKTASSLNVPQ